LQLLPPFLFATCNLLLKSCAITAAMIKMMMMMMMGDGRWEMNEDGAGWQQQVLHLICMQHATHSAAPSPLSPVTPVTCLS